MHSTTCYAQNYKEKSKRVLRAFCHGIGGLMGHTADAELGEGAAAFYGVRPSWFHLWNQVKEEGRDFFYLDNSWFDVTREECFRIGFNELQSWSKEVSDGSKFRALGIEVQEWKEGGEYILICPQSEEYLNFVGQPNWIQRVRDVIHQQTDLPIKVRHKGEKRSLQKDLKKAYMLVTHSSTCAIEALIAGVPVMVTDNLSPAYAFTSENIALPVKKEGRIDLFNQLADSQWNINELKDKKWKRDG